jgi:DNA (cytosine-5)-methyltransferase 1
MRVIWQSEIDPYASRVLKKHWPEVVNHGNIKEINWQEIERPDVICGGYPCQPFSTAGNGGSLNPTWVEWLMGFPTGWTDLKD